MACLPVSLRALMLVPAAACALQVEFTLSDKLGKPVDGATICLQEDAGQCTQTNAQGKSVFSPTVGLAIQAPGAKPILCLRGCGLVIAAEAAGTARVEVFDSRGRRVGAPRSVRVGPGENRLDLAGMGAGIAFLAVELAGKRHRVRAVALPGMGAFTATGAAKGGTALAALGKVATANLHAMVISKPGFQTVIYRPRAETESGVQIRMSVVGDSAIRYSGIIKAKVTGFDTAAHSLAYAYNEYKCTGSALSSSEQTATLPLWMKDGKWYFPAGNCQGVVLSKEGSGMFGQWKTLGVEKLPPGLFPFTCDPVKDSVVTSVLNLFFLAEGGGWDIDLRPDSMTIKINRMVCPGNQLVLNPAAFDGKEGRPLLTGNSCREVAFRNAKDEPGTYSFPLAGDSLRAQFKYGATTCTSPGVALSLETTAPKTCPETPPTALMADTAWQNCVKTSGFVQ